MANTNNTTNTNNNTTNNTQPDKAERGTQMANQNTTTREERNEADRKATAKWQTEHADQIARAKAEREARWAAQTRQDNNLLKSASDKWNKEQADKATADKMAMGSPEGQAKAQKTLDFFQSHNMTEQAETFQAKMQDAKAFYEANTTTEEPTEATETTTENADTAERGTDMTTAEIRKIAQEATEEMTNEETMAEQMEELGLTKTEYLTETRDGDGRFCLMDWLRATQTADKATDKYGEIDEETWDLIADEVYKNLTKMIDNI